MCLVSCLASPEFPFFGGVMFFFLWLGLGLGEEERARGGGRGRVQGGRGREHAAMVTAEKTRKRRKSRQVRDRRANTSVVLGSYVMYSHMMRQRRKVLRGKQPERKAVQ